MDNTITYEGYTARVEYDAQDNILVGTVINANSNLMFHADTTDLLVAEFHDVIDNYLEHCSELGIEPKKAYSGRLNLRIDPDTHARAVAKAASEGVSLNQLLDEAIRAKLAG